MTIAIPQFVTLLLVSKMFSDHGIVNTLCSNIGLTGWLQSIGLVSGNYIPFLSKPGWSHVMIILINIWVGVPYQMLSATGILMNIPTDQLESARIDGANKWHIFWKITMPYVLFICGPSLIQSIIANINNFNVIYLLSAGKPTPVGETAGKTDLLVTWLYKLTVDYQYYNIGAVIGILTFVVLSIVALVTYRNTKAYKDEEGFM